MNENIDLTKILKDCPKGWKFYSSIYGEVEFVEIKSTNVNHPIIFKLHDITHSVSSTGEHFKGQDECTFFPSREQRDWSKFTAPWYKKEKFDPKTLEAFDKVIVRNIQNSTWHIEYFSYIKEKCILYPFYCLKDNYAYCIPYNNDTKHLVGTTEEAPEYYRYWED